MGDPVEFPVYLVEVMGDDRGLFGTGIGAPSPGDGGAPTGDPDDDDTVIMTLTCFRHIRCG